MNRQNTVLRQKKAIVEAVMSGYTSKPIGCPRPTVVLCKIRTWLIMACLCGFLGSTNTCCRWAFDGKRGYACLGVEGLCVPLTFPPWFCSIEKEGL